MPYENLKQRHRQPYPKLALPNGKRAAGEEKKRPTSQQLEARHWSRAETARDQLVWNDQSSPEQGCDGEGLLVAYAPPGAMGISKQREKGSCITPGQLSTLLCSLESSTVGSSELVWWPLVLLCQYPSPCWPWEVNSILSGESINQGHMCVCTHFWFNHTDNKDPWCSCCTLVLARFRNALGKHPSRRHIVTTY